MSAIEMLVMLVLACSIFFAMTMPFTGERTGGKYAAMEYYHKVHSNADCSLWVELDFEFAPSDLTECSRLDFSIFFLKIYDSQP